MFSTTLHEASHAFAALKLGDDTAHRGGQVTLDPLPHIQREPFGMVLVPILSYAFSGWMIGWASAPYDPYWAHRHPKRAGLMAMAGPVSNLLLVLLAALLIHIGIWTEHFVPSFSHLGFDRLIEPSGEGIAGFFAVILSLMFSLNLLLFFFNLLPFPPLDGSSLPLMFLSDRAVEKYWGLLRNPMMSMIGFIVAWRLFGVIFPWIYAVAIMVLFPGHLHLR